MKTTKPTRRTQPNQNRALKPGIGGNQTKPQGPKQRVRVGGTRPQKPFGPNQNPKKVNKVKPMPKDSPTVKKSLARMRAGNTNQSLTGGKGMKGGLLTSLAGVLADQLTPIIADTISDLAIRPLVGAMTGKDIPKIADLRRQAEQGGTGSQQFNQAMPPQQPASRGPGTGAMPSFTPGMNLGGEQLLNVPVKPTPNPATAMQQQPQRPNPVPQQPAAPMPQQQQQQPPQDANEGLRMWEEIHGNAQKSVIDGMNIVERYKKKMATAGR